MAKRKTAIDCQRRQGLPVKDGALAFNDRDRGRILFGQIVDVSLEGLCFQYRDSADDPGLARTARQPGGNETLDIVFGAHDFTLTDLPVIPVSDYETAPLHPYWPVSRGRCRCVKFGKLSRDQLMNLKRFIQLSGENHLSVE